MCYKQQVGNTISGNGRGGKDNLGQWMRIDLSSVKGVCYSSNENARNRIESRECRSSLGFFLPHKIAGFFFLLRKITCFSTS